MIQCSKCKNFKDESLFNKSVQVKRGYYYYCRECFNKGNRKRLEDKNKTFTSEYNIRYERNPEKYILSQIRYSAKVRKLDFNLTIEDIVIPEYCPILKTKIIIDRSIKNNMYAPSVDRIDNNLGYIKGNVMIISRLANIMKSCASNEELINFSKYFIQNLLNS